MLISDLWPVVAMMWRASKPLLSKLVTTVARIEWFLYSLDNLAFVEIFFIALFSGSFPTGALSYQTGSAFWTFFLGRCHRKSTSLLSFETYNLNIFTGQMHKPGMINMLKFCLVN